MQDAVASGDENADVARRLTELQEAYDTAPVGLCTVDCDLRYVRINKRLAAVNGHTVEEHLGRTIREILPELADVVEARYQEVIDSAEPALNFEIHGATAAPPGDLARDYLVSYLPMMRDGKVVGVNTVVKEITQRKAAEEKLRQQVQILEQVHDGVASMALDGTIQSWNRAAERLYGYTAEEVIGRRIDLLFYEQDQLALRDRVIAALATDGFLEETVKSRRKGGEEIYVESRICLLKDEDGEAIGLIGCCHDVTEKRALRAELLEVTAQEQRRIGRELHDGTGQELTGLNYLAFSHAKTLTDRRHRNADTAVKIAEGLQRALKQVRALSKGLLPVEVDADGLMAGLNELTVRMSELNEVACIFHCKEPIPVLDQEVATQLYRIAQEALNNAIKHGRSDIVMVRLARRDRMLRLEIVDDGVGIPTPPPKDGLGLRIMASRADMIGAKLEIGPADGGGTRVACSLPWD
jgi:two-component system sensor kinase FixL